MFSWHEVWRQTMQILPIKLVSLRKLSPSSNVSTMQIMVKRENPNFLIFNAQKITGLCHQDFGCWYKNSDFNNRRELKVIELFKFRQLQRSATMLTRILLFAKMFRMFSWWKQFVTKCKYIIAGSSVRELKLYIILPYLSMCIYKQRANVFLPHNKWRVKRECSSGCLKVRT